ncbi:FAD-dependent oxidoreductase, partial [Odoribacter sp. OttesenSCG-928-A06]|nr:FAD-dependent oxidoreductase [Odoribacter sp. OttesenSCG-928-A06]
LDTTGYDVVSFNGDSFRFPNGKEAFIEQIASYFPKEKDNLAKYYNLINNIAQSSALHTVSHLETNMAINVEYQLRSMNAVLEEMIGDPFLQNILAGNLPLYAAKKDKTPFSSHAFIVDFYNQSAFRMIGGSESIGVSLSNTIQKWGGQVLTHHKAIRVECDDSKATGVETENGKLFPADYVISDIHPKKLLEITDSKLIRSHFRNRINMLPNTTAIFSVYLHFRENTVPYMNHNFYGYRSDSPWGCEDYTEENWPKGYMYMHFCHQNNPQYAKGGVIFSYMSKEEVAPWEDTTVGRRGDSYQAFKKQKAEVLLSAVEKDFPHLRNNIANYYTSSPLTYRDYTGTEDGSIYGIAKDITSGISSHISHRTRVPNLFLAGQNTNSHGMLGVLIGSILACSDLIGNQIIHHQITEANR